MTRISRWAWGIGSPLVVTAYAVVAWNALVAFEPKGRILAEYTGCHLHCAPAEDPRFLRFDTRPYEPRSSMMMGNGTQNDMTCSAWDRLEVHQNFGVFEAFVRRWWPDAGHLATLSTGPRQNWKLPPGHFLSVYRESKGRLIKREATWSERLLDPWHPETFEVLDARISLNGRIVPEDALWTGERWLRYELHVGRELPPDSAVGGLRQRIWSNAVQRALASPRADGRPPVLLLDEDSTPPSDR